MAVDFDKMYEIAARASKLAREDNLRFLVYGLPPLHSQEIEELNKQWLSMYAEYCSVSTDPA